MYDNDNEARPASWPTIWPDGAGREVHKSLCMIIVCICGYVHIVMCMYIYIYIYTYVERERDYVCVFEIHTTI